MSLLNDADRRFLTTLSRLAYCNPFEPVRIELERDALGDDHEPEDAAFWSRTAASDARNRPNVIRLNDRAERLVRRLHESLTAGKALSERERPLYEDLVTYVLYYRHVAGLPAAALAEGKLSAQGRKSIAAAWRAFRDDHRGLLASIRSAEDASEAAHLFACLYQVRRAFAHIFNCLIGQSTPAARLRAQVWQSIFTHDLRRYRRTLYARMGELATLVTGPSGAGKELVARAIGLSQYRAFDPATERLADADAEGPACVALNLSALSPTLIESELFGHRRGSFTGATADRVGWLDRCAPHGAVFLDEIGDLDPAIQVKLLRVVQQREYSRLGESEPRRFAGKLLAATNRDLAVEMHAGRFREDLYYRLCSDRIVAPSLHDQLADRPAALEGLVRFLAYRTIGEEPSSEAETLADEVLAWVGAHLPGDYAWPGNIRELEQCVRNVLVRREYRPADPAPSGRPDWLDRAAAGELTADELLDHYCRQVHRQRGGYEQAARLLGLDRRTVKARAARAPQ